MRKYSCVTLAWRRKVRLVLPFRYRPERIFHMFSRRSLFATLGLTLSSLAAVTAEAAVPAKKPLRAKATSKTRHVKAKTHAKAKQPTLS